ncbi:kinase-like domain-containing protein [Xylaria arbuscula]|nr:kinase-like domain-containing protein [Xylaria arbuscula]
MASYNPITLPYYAPSETLPEPLPTLEEILSSKRFLMDPGNLQYKRCTTVRVHSSFVAKFGEDVRSIEAETMLFVKENTKIPVPEVYAIYKFGKNDKMTMIIQECIEGFSIADCMEFWEPGEVESIKEKLTAQTDELRAISALGYYGAIGRRPLFDPYKAVEFGPFDNFRDFNRAWQNIFFPPDRKGKRFADVRKFFAISFECIATAKGHIKPVFTHCDLHEGNILVKSDGTPVIIDYEAAGFYPAYIERLQQQNNSSFQLDFLREKFHDECEIQFDAQTAWQRAESEDSLERLSYINYDING